MENCDIIWYEVWFYINIKKIESLNINIFYILNIINE